VGLHSKLIICLMGTLGLFSSLCFAQDSSIVLRPHAGMGSLDGSAYHHGGGRLLLNTNTFQKYGLELTRLKTTQGDFVAAGIVLEQRLHGWFNMSIGTIGYFSQGSATVQNQPGLVSNLGWEPLDYGVIKPFITYRNDILFGNKTRVGQSLSIGFALGF
jgi:hypothetical protein